MAPWGSEVVMDGAEYHSTIAVWFDDRYVRSPAFIERKRIWGDLIRRYCGRQSTVLDAGCGSGVLSFAVAETARSVVGVDASPEMIALCEKKRQEISVGNVEFRTKRLEELADLGELRFDVILCSSVLEYVEEFWARLDDLAIRLSPQGVLLFSMPNEASFYRKIERIIFALTGRPRYLAFVRNRIPLEGLISGLATRDLEVLETRYYAPAAFISGPARFLGVARLADNLLAIACQKCGGRRV
jgi:ubiquinone/menaquinone biosynthesis C-methylase UbiE